jgi:hypothetical protein
MFIVDFDPIEHKYTHHNTKEQFISVTQIIERYINKFDAGYWSEYKAIERIITDNIGEAGWKEWKKQVGWKNVITEFHSVAKEENRILLPTVIADILLEWDNKNKKACDEGSAFHNTQEEYWKSKWVHLFGNKFRKYREQTKHSNYSERTIEDGIYTEYRVWSPKHRLAGHADLPIVEKPYIDINDYKTNLKLDFDNFRDPVTGHQMMKGCLSHLKDCNGNHYNVQLSLYAKLFEIMFGLKVRNIQIDYALRDAEGQFNGKVEKIPLPYLEDEVIAILKDRENEVKEQE